MQVMEKASENIGQRLGKSAFVKELQELLTDLETEKATASFDVEGCNKHETIECLFKTLIFAVVIWKMVSQWCFSLYTTEHNNLKYEETVIYEQLENLYASPYLAIHFQVPFKMLRNRKW